MFSEKTESEWMNALDVQNENVCRVLRENWNTVQVWQHIGSMWKYAPMGGIVDLN